MMGNYHVRFGGQGNQSTDPTISIKDGYFLSILSRPYLFILSNWGVRDECRYD